MTAFPESVAQLRATLGPTREAVVPLLPALAALDWVITLPNAAAPHFVYLAGACGGVPVGGGGRDLDEAAGRLAGEAAEVLAQRAAPTLCTGQDDPAISAVWTNGRPHALVPAFNLTRDRHGAAPATAIHTDPVFDSERREDAPPRSLGLAAGSDPAAARLGGLLELIERDAAARWWAGERRPRMLDAGQTVGAAADLVRLRSGAVLPGRGTSFLELASPTGLPVVCALSRDPDGRGLALGFKAALGLRAATQAALVELLQMEIGLEMARHRRAQGRSVPGDAGPLGRAALDPEAFAAFAALPPRLEARPSIAGLDDLVGHLADLGYEATAVDLRPTGGLAVAKVFVPGLRPMPGGAERPQAGAPGERAELM
ncbi:MAG: YcaO-like family protein [Amaricoccus sp.]